MKSHTKHVTGPAQEQTQLSHTQAHPTAGREFASAEEALRADLHQTVVPPAIEHRLSKSIEQLPKPGRPWWKRWLGD